MPSSVPDHLRDRPWLQPVYDEPEFIVHNVWRLYGGWYDGNPATLKPASEAALATEIAELAGGAVGAGGAGPGPERRRERPARLPLRRARRTRRPRRRRHPAAPGRRCSAPGPAGNGR